MTEPQLRSAHAAQLDQAPERPGFLTVPGSRVPIQSRMRNQNKLFRINRDPTCAEQLVDVGV